MKYILSIDQGTTSSRAIIFDHSGNVISIAQKEVECFFPRSGWVESDANQIWSSVVNCINDVLIKSNLSWKDIDSIGITNQRETTVIWEKSTGLPVYNAVIWQSRQSKEICDALENKKEFIHQKTGLIINPYFSASKIRFILDHINNGQKRAKNGELLFGTIDTWLIYKLTKGQVHATDVSNASRTLLFNISELQWDKEMINLFDIPECMLPKVLPSSGDFGIASFFADNVHIFGVAGDQQAALFGQNCFNPGDSKNTYGTGCFMLMNTGEKPTFSKNGLLTTIAWKIKDKVYYALEGSVFIGGSVIQWLRDELKIIENASESEQLAESATDEGVYIVPAFTGLGTPYWDNDARGAIFGLTRGTSRKEFAKASLESIAYQSKDVFEVMKKECGYKIKCLRVDGGATKNNYLMQFQSDILEATIKLPKCLETTALGAAYLAGLGSGYFQDIDEIKSIHSYQATYNPHMAREEIKARYNGWKKAIKATRSFKI